MTAPLKQFALIAATLLGLLSGTTLYLLGVLLPAQWILTATVLGVLLWTSVSAARDLLQHRIGVDLIAILAMAGALALRQYLTGAIIAAMLTGGGALEQFALLRARRELSALLQRAPRIAHRKDGPRLVDVPVEEVVIGDTLVVKPGEVIPADGVVRSEEATLDEAALSGESRPVRIAQAMPVRSGGTNSGAAFDLQVTAPPSESTYAGIIRLVRAAEESKAPFVRLADQYALGFLLLTLALAAFAWAAEGNPMRALAVLVVATPCPLILAPP